MLKIRFIVVDRTRSPFLKEGESYYLERLRKYARVEWIEVKQAKIRKGLTTEDILIYYTLFIKKLNSIFNFILFLYYIKLD